MLNLAELDRAEKIIAAGRKPPRSFVYTDMENPLEVLVAGVRPLLELVDRLGEILAMRGCVRRGPGGHYNSVRCLDQGTREHGSNEYGDKPLAKEKWCDGCTALAHYQRAKGGSP